MAYKNAEIDWAAYAALYFSEMREAYKENPAVFKNTAKRLDNVEFICWCNNKRIQDKKCHRFLLMEIMEKVRMANNYV